jgi:hypothetical protein
VPRHFHADVAQRAPHATCREKKLSCLKQLSHASSYRSYSLSQPRCTLTCFYNCCCHDLHAHRLPTLRCIPFQVPMISSLMPQFHALNLTVRLALTSKSVTCPTACALHVMPVLIHARALLKNKCCCYKLRLHTHLHISFTRSCTHNMFTSD